MASSLKWEIASHGARQIAQEASPQDSWKETLAEVSPKERKLMCRTRSQGISSFNLGAKVAEVPFARCTNRFDGLDHIQVTLSEDKKQAAVDVRGGGYLTAASSAQTPMRGSGQHFVEITLLKRVDGCCCGVIRPEFDVERAENAYDVEGHCFYDTRAGFRYPGPLRWDGCEGARDGDRVGLLLDLEAGSLTVYKNEARLGMITSSGLSGEFCWAVCMYGQGSKVQIEAKPLPSEYEQAAALAAKQKEEEDLAAYEAEQLALKEAQQRQAEEALYKATALGALAFTGAPLHMLETEEEKQTVAASMIQNRWRAAREKAEASRRHRAKQRVAAAAASVSFTLDESMSAEQQPFQLTESGCVATIVRESTDRSYQYIRTGSVMRDGRHHAEFTLLKGDFMLFGIMRPNWCTSDVERGEAERGRNGSGVYFERDHCFYYTNTGHLHPGQRKWAGMRNAIEGDRIGLVLDLALCSLTVYKNGERLGFISEPRVGENWVSASGMKAGGDGYCWAVCLNREGDSVRVTPLQPPILTDDEFRWKDEHDKKKVPAVAEQLETSDVDII